MNKTSDNSLTLNRILICGLGSIGRRHVRTIKKCFPGVQLGVVRSGFGTQCPEQKLISKHFTDLHAALLWLPDAAVISGPAPCHQQQALVLAREGIPLLIEKPIGDGNERQEEWEELNLLSNKVPVLVGYVLRHDPCAKFVNQKIKSEYLGKVIEADFYCGSWLPEWRPNHSYENSVSSCRSLGGGALLELSHEIDLARWFLGKIDISFATLLQSGLLDLDVEDQAYLFGKSSNCPIVSIRLNFCSRPSRRCIVIRCEDGEIVWDVLNGVAQCSANRQETTEKFESSLTSNYHYETQMKHFFSCVTSSEKPLCNLSDGIEVLKIIQQARFISETK